MNEQTELNINEMQELIQQIHKASLPQLQEIQKHVNHEITLALNEAAPENCMDPDEFFCDRCGSISKEAYETADGNYICQDCYTSGPEEDDYEQG